MATSPDGTKVLPGQSLRIIDNAGRKWGFNTPDGVYFDMKQIWIGGAKIGSSQFYSFLTIYGGIPYTKKISGEWFVWDGSVGDWASSADPTKPKDTTPPTIPAGLTATAKSSSEIDLAWAASTDDVGVTGYRVYRGDTEIVQAGNKAYAHVECGPCGAEGPTIWRSDFIEMCKVAREAWNDRVPCLTTTP